MVVAEINKPLSGLDPSIQTIVASKGENQGSNTDQIDPLLLAYMYIFESVQTGRETAQIQAKSLENNVEVQNKLINEEATKNFYALRQSQIYNKVTKTRVKHQTWDPGCPGTHWIPPHWNVWYTTHAIQTRWVGKKDVAPSVLANFEEKNQEVSATRGIIESQITVLRQDAQIKETGLNSSVDEDQQAIQQGASLMQMLVSLTNQISRI